MKRLLGALLMCGISSVHAGEPWAGLYRKPDRTAIGVGELHEFGKAEILVDYTSGETGALFQLPNGKTGVGRAIGEPVAPSRHSLQRQEGKVLLDGEALAEVEIIRQPFAVENGPVTLAGELLHGKETPRGVLVLVHGSGDGPRRAYDLWTNFFLAQSWAVAVFDKRGSGSSSGDWHEATFSALAGDVRAVLAWVRMQPQAKGRKVGVWGVSQAGWIISLLAAEHAADFAIMQAGSVTPVDEFLRQTLEAELRAYGFATEEIAKAQEYYALDSAVSEGKQPFSAIADAYEKAKAAEWVLKPPSAADSPDRHFMAAISGFDPAPFWRKVRVPLLAIFGGKDNIVPAEPNLHKLKAFMADAGNTQAEIELLTNDNHLNMLAKTGVRAEYPTLNRFDPDYFRLLARFLERMAAAGQSIK